LDRPRLLERIDTAWRALHGAYDGLSEARLQEPGANGDWSVKDILAHVTTWEEEALKYLPLIREGGRPPRYVTFGGIDAFNARMREQKRGLTLADVVRQADVIHRRLLRYLEGVPEEQFVRETRFRRRLRLDSYGHYLEHAKAIRAWRLRLEGEPAPIDR